MKVESKTIGILGGGQLGRMSVLAAARLGMKCHIYCPEIDSPASQVAALTINGDYDDKKKLAEFAAGVDVISYEFENIPVEAVRYLQKLKPVFPDDRLLEIAQHRPTEKKFLNDIGISTARWGVAQKASDIDTVMADMKVAHCILKTTRFGYDGKGQMKFVHGDNAKEAWKKLGGQELIVEEMLDFACEISTIIARDKLGQTAIYGPVLNEHRNHILAKSTVPAPIPEEMGEKARAITRLLADAVDLVGVLALEMFITRDGHLLANEIAPRTHNSGHWTIDACAVSQFEQHVRTIAGMPVGTPARHSDAVMFNLIGMDAHRPHQWLEKKNACLHLYGKDEIKEGRKMGHVTILADKP
ncbi:MAG: 5-(carboxyamino)imidazole ribonucleotide synthase [Micavibrio sp.]